MIQMPHPSRTPPPLYAFVHLPKTAGQSIRSHLNAAFSDPLATAPVNEHADFQGPRLDALLARGDRLHLLVGHRVTRSVLARFDGRDIRKVTLLRDPLRYMVSFFNYGHRGERAQNGPGGTDLRRYVEGWIRSHRNPQARWLLRVHDECAPGKVNRMEEEALLEAASQVLGTFWCIGNVEDIEASLRPVFVALGAQTEFARHMNRAGREYSASLSPDLPWIEEVVRPHVRVDQDLYDRFAAPR